MVVGTEPEIPRFYGPLPLHCHFDGGRDETSPRRSAATHLPRRVMDIAADLSFSPPRSYTPRRRFDRWYRSIAIWQKSRGTLFDL
jgi:hypothetical protein